MKPPTKSFKMMVLAAAVAIAGVLSSVAVAVPKGPTVVAVLDVQKAFTDLKEKDQIEVDQNRGVERIQDEQRKRSKEIEDLQKSYELLETLPEDDPNKIKKRDELTYKMAELQAWLQIEQARLNRDTAARLEGVRNKMLDTIAEVAKANKIDVVLNVETTVQLPRTGNRQASVNIRHVLWNTESLDITDDVVQRMNNQ